MLHTSRVFLAAVVLLLFFAAGCGKTAPMQTESVVNTQTLQTPAPSVRPPAVTSHPIPTPMVFSNTAGNILNWGLVAQSGDWIYYLNSQDGERIYKIHTDGTGKAKLNDAESSYINVSGSWVYFCNEDDDWKLYKMRTDGTQLTKVNDQRSQDIHVVGDQIYFISGNIYMDSPGSIYSMKTDGSEKIQLTKDICQDINIIGKTIYYANWSDNGSVYSMQNDGTNRKKLNDDVCLDLIAKDNWLYYRNDKGTRGLVKIRVDGSGRTVLYKGAVYCLNVLDGYIYFSHWKNGANLPGPMYRISVDGGEASILNPNEGCSDVNLIEGWIYFYVLGEKDQIFRMRIDGTDRQVVN